ncbi:MAG TPA: hypothetical protein VNG90_04965 [Candidatus Acidoferrum sp.]|nr:hypothetical protein [Candidatus Acidoferrum sp.]
MPSQEHENVWLDRPPNTGVVELVVQVRLATDGLRPVEKVALRQVLLGIAQSFIAEPQDVTLEQHQDDPNTCFVVIAYPPRVFRKTQQLSRQIKAELENAIGACVDGFLSRPIPPRKVVQQFVEVAVPGNWKAVGLIGSLYIILSIAVPLLIMGGSLQFMSSWPSLVVQLGCLSLSVVCGFLYIYAESTWAHFRER